MRRLTSWPQASAAAGHGENYLTHDRGLWSWVFTLDHKRIGVMYLVGILTSFLLGGIFALLIRVQLLTPGRIVAYQGPLQPDVHAARRGDDLPVHHPRHPGRPGQFRAAVHAGGQGRGFSAAESGQFLSLGGGAVFFLVACAGRPGHRLDLLHALQHNHQRHRRRGHLGAFILGFSSIFTGHELHRHDPHDAAAGHDLVPDAAVPVGLYATAIIQVLATPVLAITLLLLAAEKLFRASAFSIPSWAATRSCSSTSSGSTRHPAVYIMILPAMGIISELISVFSRKHIFGYRFIAYSSMAIALLWASWSGATTCSSAANRRWPT